MANPVGRPTKYTPEFLELAKSYLENYESEHKHTIPSVAGLSEIANIRRSTLYEWSGDENKAEFTDIFRSILAKQERLLLDNGLNNKFSSAITKLVLGKHGYHDKQDTELTGRDGGKIETTFNFLPVNNKE